MGVAFIRRAGIQFKAWIKVIGIAGYDITISGPKGEQTQTIGADGTTTFLVKKKGDYTITSSYESASSGSTIKVNKRKNIYEIELNRYTPVITSEVDSITLNGGDSEVTEYTVTVKGNNEIDNLGDLLVTSNNESVATGALTKVSETSDTIIYSLQATYKTAGSAKLTIYINSNNYYNYSSATVSVVCARTSVTIPTLKSTSVACIGSAVSPGVNNLDTNLVTQSGTTSASTLGTWTVKWDLKDTNRYCWSDGTIVQKAQNWSTYGGTITIYTPATGVVPAITWQGTFAAWASFSPSNISGGGVGSYKYYWTYTSSNTVRIKVTYLSTGSDETRKWYYRQAYVNITGSAPTNGASYTIYGYSDGLVP